MSQNQQERTRIQSLKEGRSFIRHFVTYRKSDDGPSLLETLIGPTPRLEALRAMYDVPGATASRMASVACRPNLKLTDQ